MNEFMGGGIGIIIFIFLFILAILWFLLPFAIFGTKDKLSELISESKKTNQHLANLINEMQSLSALSVTNINTSVEKEQDELNNEELMKKYNIIFTNDKYSYKNFTYDNLKDAVDYAKKQA